MTEQGNALLNELNNVVRERNNRRLTRAKAEFKDKFKELKEKSKCLFDMADDISTFDSYVEKYKGKYNYKTSMGLVPEAKAKNKFCYNKFYKSSNSEESHYFSFGDGTDSFYTKIIWKDNKMTLSTRIESDLKDDGQGDYTLKVVEILKSAISELDNIKNSYNTFMDCVKAYIEQKKGEC